MSCNLISKWDLALYVTPAIYSQLFPSFTGCYPCYVYLNNTVLNNYPYFSLCFHWGKRSNLFSWCSSIEEYIFTQCIVCGLRLIEYYFVANIRWSNSSNLLNLSTRIWTCIIRKQTPQLLLGHQIWMRSLDRYFLSRRPFKS